MFRKRLVATAAAAPLLMFASASLAETTITDTRTTGVSTATINNGSPDDLRITSTGKIKPTTGGVAGAISGAVTINSNNDVTNEGAISATDVDYIAGIRVLDGAVGDILNKGSITLDDSSTPKDDDKDGDDDGPLATGTNRFGILVEGSMTGNITNDTGGAIVIEGNNSAGILVKGALTGNFLSRAPVTITGDNALGIGLRGPVNGNVEISGTVTSLGSNAVGVSVDDITGQLLIQGAISSRGYRYGVRGTADFRSKLDADDLLQNGGALIVAGNVGGGILLDAPPNAGIDYDGDGIRNADDPDDDNDGILDADDGDLDNDGRKDSSEGTASLVSVGEAPALAIGSTTESIVIGKVAATGDDAYGLVMRGSITAAGVYDGVDATGIWVGAGAGQTTTLENGMRIQGAITSVAYEGYAQAIHLGSGAIVPELNLSGTIFASTNATSKPYPESDFAAFGVRIDQNAIASTLNNSGLITAQANGENSFAVAIWDRAGGLTSITNTGKIAAVVNATDDADDTDDADTDPENEVVTGEAIAIDVRYASAGVTIIQDGVNDGDDDLDPSTTDPDADGDGVDDADEPGIIGNIHFGAFDDTLDLRNGTFAGDIWFGAGADTYKLSGGAEAKGAIRDSDGQLTVDVGAAKLTITNAEVIAGTSLTIGSAASVMFTADPTAGTNTRFDVATATIGNGAKIGLTVTDLLTGPERFVVVHTDTPAGLTAGTLDQSLVGNSPYLYVAQAGVDSAAGEVYVDMRRRTAAEMELSQNQALALDAVYEALGADTEIRDSFLSADNRKDFLNRYEQMLPDQGEGLFSSLENVSRTVSRLTATRPDLRQRYGPDSFWIQEVNAQVMREAGVTAGSETKAFGFVGGYESMGADGGALGATLAFVAAEEKDEVAQIGEETSVALMEAGIYWRRSIGKFTINARGAGGYGWFNGDRVFIDPTNAVIVKANSDWTGFTAAGSLAASYELTAGRFYLRPTASIDYMYLSEQSRKETGLSNGFNQEVGERTSDRLSGTLELAMGATFGRDLWWRPEIRVGYRQHMAGDMGDTVFRFVGGQWVALPATEPGDGAAIIGLSLQAGTPMSYVAIEGEYESLDGEDRYNLQLAGRVMF